MTDEMEMWDLQGPWLIVIDEDGMAITNQCGGYACLHPSAVGFLLRLPLKLETEIFDYFVGDKWGGWCDKGIDAETADFLDPIIKPHGLTVDRDKMGDDMEAWIHVRWRDRAAILTWGNSD